MFHKGGFIRSAIRKRRHARRLNRQIAKNLAEPNLQLMPIPGVYDYWDWPAIGGSASPQQSKHDVDCYIWFVPYWTNVWGGGHYTLFRFANHFASKGTRQIIYTYDRAQRSPAELEAELGKALKKSRLEVITDPKLLPECAVALATTWQSAYFVKSFPFARSKFYFMQDFESHFYAHGTASMQANNTYSFGFPGITGGLWNKAMYEACGGNAEPYIFSTDRDIFFPASAEATVRDKVSRIFFYGRPSTERRCFELGVASLQKISSKYPNIEIVMAGLDIASSMPFKATMLGNLSLAKTGELYRTCDIGIAFSGTNLSYLPVELMACGVPVISNRGPHVEWYCTDRVNSLLVDPTPTSVLHAVDLLVSNAEIRQSIVREGLVESGKRTWESEMDRIFEYIQRERSI